METYGKINKHFDTDQKEDSLYKDLPEPKTNIRKLPTLIDPSNQKKPELSTRLKIKNEQKYKILDSPKVEIQQIDEDPIKNPRVQIVKEGQFFNRRGTFIKNWEFDEENVNQEAPNQI